MFRVVILWWSSRWFRGRRRSSRKSLGLEDEVDLKVPSFGECPDNKYANDGNDDDNKAHDHDGIGLEDKIDLKVFHFGKCLDNDDGDNDDSEWRCWKWLWRIGFMRSVWRFLIMATVLIMIIIYDDYEDDGDVDNDGEGEGLNLFLSFACSQNLEHWRPQYASHIHPFPLLLLLLNVIMHHIKRILSFSFSPTGKTFRLFRILSHWSARVCSIIKKDDKK